MVYDIHRPDVNGVRPKMEILITLFGNPDELRIPYYRVKTDDNIMSSITVVGSFDPAETWVYKIYENSRYFRFSVKPEKNKRYYREGERVTVEMISSCYKLTNIDGFKKFRKYTGSPDQCANKLKAWLEYTANLVNP